MSTAALDVSERSHDRGADGPSDVIDVAPREPSGGVDRLGIVALVLRPPVIFFATTGVAYALYASTALQAEDAGPDGYGRWLSDLLPLPAAVGRAAGHSLQLLVASTLVAVVIGALLGLSLRLGRLRRLGAALGVGLLSVAAPVVGLTLYYWFVVRLDPGLDTGSVSILEDWQGSVERLVLPALTVGLSLVPPVAAMVARPAFSSGPYGGAAMAAPLADRTVSHRPWRRGLPTGLVVAGLLAAEVLFEREGLFALAVGGSLDPGQAPSLAAVAVLALVGAGLALLVDLAELRQASTRTAPLTALPGRPQPRPRPRMVRVAVSLILALVALGAAGLVWGQDPQTDPESSLGQPLLDGLLGRDSEGRDLLALATSGLGWALVAAALAALAASLAAAALVAWQRRFPRTGRLLPGVLVDALWWPLPLVLIFAAAVFVPSNPLEWRFLGLVMLGLLPGAMRLAHRLPSGDRPTAVAGLAGMWLFATAAAMLASAVASFALPILPLSLGGQLASATRDLARSPWPAVVPAVTLTAALFACYHLGSYLVTLAWHRAGAGPDVGPGPGPVGPVAADWTVSGEDADEGGLSGGTGAGTSGESPALAPTTTSGASGAWAPTTTEGARGAGTSEESPALAPTITEGARGAGTSEESRAAAAAAAGRSDPSGPSDRPEGPSGTGDRYGRGGQVGPQAVSVAAGDRDPAGRPGGVWSTGDRRPAGPAGPAGSLLTPNYSLQPGLPHTGLTETMQLPVVRVRVAPVDEVGTEDDGP